MTTRPSGGGLSMGEGGALIAGNFDAVGDIDT
jgi:hypothetical protein